MVLDFEVKPNLKSFCILQSPTGITSLVQHELDENTFASLVIQLPSKFDGGEHRIIPTCSPVYHNERFFDFSIKSNGKCEFSSYCIVFHRDYKHEMKPITDGIGAYLVYDLIVDSSDVFRVPKTPTIEDMDNEMSLRSMLHNWTEPAKIVIGLSNTYAKEDLSLENLKSVDLAIAKQLKKQYSYLTDYGQFEMFLGYLTRTYHGEIVAANTTFNTNDASNILQTEYHIECLKHIDGKRMVNFRYFNVKFDDEVWPPNCFDGVKPYRCVRERPQHTDPEDEYEVGLHVAKYYRRPVIALFIRYNIIDELKNSYVDVADIYKMFITLYEEYEGKPVEKFIFRDAARFDRWAWSVSCMHLPKEQQYIHHELTVSFLKILIRLGDVTGDTRAIKHYFECYKRALTEEIIPVLIVQCNKCKWLPFSQILCDMFKATKTFAKAQKYLTCFIDDDSGNSDPETLANKQTVLQSVFTAILDKQKRRFDYDFKKFFHLAWNMAKNGRLDLREYGKLQTIDNVVPFLIEMAEQDADNKSDNTWLDLANHFLKIMETRIAKNLETSWRLPNVKISGRCTCIQDLLIFLKDDLQSTTFHLQKIHRKHFESVCSRISSVQCLSSEDAGVGNLFVLKTQKVGQPNKFKLERMLTMLEKLRSIVCQT